MKQVQEGIEQARAAFSTCANCRKLFRGRESPARILDWLLNHDAMIVTEKRPTAYSRANDPEQTPTGVQGPEKFSPETAAESMFKSTTDGQISFRCMYVNALGFLVKDPVLPYKGTGGFEGLSLPQARGTVVLHELAHLVNAIQQDGKQDGKKVKNPEKKNRQNSQCVGQHCFLSCVNAVKPCPNVPPRRSRRQPPPKLYIFKTVFVSYNKVFPSNKKRSTIGDVNGDPPAVSPTSKAPLE